MALLKLPHRLILSDDSNDEYNFENDASDAMRQALYWLTLRLELENGTVSDTVPARFGVREIHSEVDPMLQGHVFYVNGQRVSS